jgi:hypothetical protein
MKTFNQLTIEQQEKAIAFAYDKLIETINAGYLEVENKSIPHLHVLAEIAAQGSKYHDDGTAIVEMVLTPSYYQGGCV